jgi:hypothetical protein
MGDETFELIPGTFSLSAVKRSLGQISRAREKSTAFQKTFYDHLTIILRRGEAVATKTDIKVMMQLAITHRHGQL